MDSTQFTTDEVDLEAYRARLRRMNDEELIRERKAENSAGRGMKGVPQRDGALIYL
jgi:hypothetical protein